MNKDCGRAIDALIMHLQILQMRKRLPKYGWFKCLIDKEEE